MIVANVDENRERVYSWASQARQYAPRAEPGIHHVRAYLRASYLRGGGETYVDCLLYYSKDGKLRGILNHYPTRTPFTDGFGRTKYEEAGNVNMWVEPRYHGKGIGKRLLAEADRRWHINFEQQRYTAAGAALVNSYLRHIGKDIHGNPHS